jgi:subtilase family serine protease
MRVMSILFLFLALGLSSCVSPGQPYTYLDIEYAVPPVLSPAQPATNQAVTVSFAIRNTWNQDLPAVPWVVYANSDPGIPTSGTILIPSSTVDVPAFGSANLTFVIPAQIAGTYTYSIVLDQAQVYPERNFNNNTSTFSVTFADQDITFGSIPATITDTTNPSDPLATDNLTLSFSIQNTVNPAQTAPQSVNVTYQIFINSTTSVVGPITVLVPPSTTAATPITVPLPPTGSAGSFIYTIVLSTANGLDNNPSDNIEGVEFTIPAPN